MELNNGLLNRDNDLPAIEHSNGTKQWFKNDFLHRENRPAVNEYDGTEEYYFLGKKFYSVESFYKFSRSFIENQLFVNDKISKVKNILNTSSLSNKKPII